MILLLLIIVSKNVKNYMEQFNIALLHSSFYLSQVPNYHAYKFFQYHSDKILSKISF